MAEPRPSLAQPIVLIEIVLVAAGVGGGLLFEYNHPKPIAPPRTVQVGDNVTVNYIGLFASGPQTGRTFDTSIYSVAVNNVSYPKSLEFSMRGSPGAYAPLPVYVGPSTPSGGYSLDGLTFSSVVTGFWQGLLGLPVNQTRTITFPASEGYGPTDPACLVVRPLTVEVPVLIAVPPQDFSTAYPGANATPGVEFPDPAYGWTDLVLSANATAVVVENLPSVGWAVPGSSWPEVVTAATTGTITVTNELTSANAGRVAGHSATQVCSSSQYIVSSVDVQNGTYTEDFNHEVVGQSLTFVVTVYRIY